MRVDDVTLVLRCQLQTLL